MLNRLGNGRFKAYSAGSHPAGRVNPFALELLQQGGYDTRALRSKSWDEFAGAAAPRFDFIITVCDNAAAETCPAWPGHPVTAHWGVADPAAVEGDNARKRAAFLDAASVLRRRIELLVHLPLEKLDALAVPARLREIGYSP